MNGKHCLTIWEGGRKVHPMSERDDIIRAVAEGRLSPLEGVRRLDELDAAAQASSDRLRKDPPPAEARTQGPVRPLTVLRTVRIRAVHRAVRVFGDPTVAEAAAEGPHTARREGDVMIVEGESGPGALGGATRSAGYRFAFERRRGPEAWVSPFAELTRDLVVRVNPRTAVDVAVVAGSLTVVGVGGSVRAEVTAGSARLDVVRGPIELVVRGGSATVEGRLVEGASTVRCEAGSVALRLDETSDVRVRARSALSRVVLLGEPLAGEEWGATTEREVVLGGGAATLDIDASMSSVTLAAPAAARW